MKTQDFIAALTADLDAPPMPMGRSFALAFGAGLVVSAVPFFLLMGPRDTFAASLDDPRFLFKFLFTLTMTASGFLLAWRLARPDARLGALRLAALAAPALLLLACLAELAIAPETTWMARMIGHNAVHCVTMVPLMAAAPLAGLLLALRHAAPGNPRQAGAAAGLAAAGLSATLYAMNCPDDSPLFLAVWYVLGTLIVVLAGWIAGDRWLRW